MVILEVSEGKLFCELPFSNTIHVNDIVIIWGAVLFLFTSFPGSLLHDILDYKMNEIIIPFNNVL